MLAAVIASDSSCTQAEYSGLAIVAESKHCWFATGFNCKLQLAATAKKSASQMKFDFRGSWNHCCFRYCSNGLCCFHGYRLSINCFGNVLDARHLLLGSHRGPYSIHLQNCDFLASSVLSIRLLLLTCCSHDDDLHPDCPGIWRYLHCYYCRPRSIIIVSFHSNYLPRC